MFPARGKIIAIATEDACSPDRSEASGNLLLHLRHADIVFTLVVGKGYPLVRHETKDLGFIISEALEQVSRSTSFDTAPPRFAQSFLGAGTFLAAAFENRSVAPHKSLCRFLGEGSPRALDGVPDFNEELLHLPRPFLPVLLPGALKFS